MSKAFHVDGTSRRYIKRIFARLYAWCLQYLSNHDPGPSCIPSGQSITQKETRLARAPIQSLRMRDATQVWLLSLFVHMCRLDARRVHCGHLLTVTQVYCLKCRLGQSRSSQARVGLLLSSLASKTRFVDDAPDSCAWPALGICFWPLQCGPPCAPSELRIL